MRIRSTAPRYAPYLFLLPFAAIFVAFILWPLVRSLFLAFTTTAGPGSSVYVGSDNFAFLLRDPDFWLALRNTLVFALATILIQTPLSLGLALLLNAKGLWLRNTLRFAFFSPHLMGLVFAAILFTLLFAPMFGLINIVLHDATQWAGDNAWSLENKWLTDAKWVMPSIILVNLWLNIGYSMIYFLAALQGVDKELYEAARIDGAGRWSQFWHITLPGIRHVLIFVVVLSTIGSFQLFELPYLLLNNTAGPEQSGLTLVMYLYQNGFVSGDLGYASAIGWSLVLLVLVITLVQIFFSGAGKKDAV